MVDSLSSKWPKTLELRLGKLSESSSKESFQTLARWIVFHRKHLEDLKGPVVAKLATAKSPVAVSVLSALFLLYKGQPKKWSDLANLRVKVAECCLLDPKALISKEGIAAIHSHLDDWDSEDCFGVPDIIQKLKKKLNGEIQSPETSVAGSTTAAATSTLSIQDDKPTVQEDEGVRAEDDDDVPMEDDPPESMAPDTTKPKADDNTERNEILTSSEKKRKLSSGTTKPGVSKRIKSPAPDVESFNFEELGVAERTVDPAELLDECRTLATLQIGRDLRAEKVHRIANLLQHLPEKVQAALADSSIDASKIDDKLAEEFSLLVSDELLDLDLAVHLAAVRSNKTLVEQQNAARRTMIRLLQESRCKFGSMETAAIYSDPEITDLSFYNEQSQELGDLLDLEGQDVDKVLAEEDQLEEVEQEFENALPPIDWYQEKTKSKDTVSAG